MRIPGRMVSAALLLGLVGLLSGASIAFAQSQEACPRPPGFPAPPPNLATAAQVENGDATLQQFVRSFGYLASLQRYSEATGYIGCLLTREGPFFSGSTYFVTMTLTGRVDLHGKNVGLSGGLLKPDIVEQITRAASSSPFGGPFMAEAANAAGYAVGGARNPDGSPAILVAGFDLQESHLVPEVTAPDDVPAVTARDVVDRASLKAFVDGAIAYFIRRFETEGYEAALKVKRVFRDPNGPWRAGPVYLFVIDINGFTLFHGAFPEKFELQTPTDTLRDVVTGELILPQIIEAATRSLEGGGFVEYHFDNPDDDTDSAEIPKVTYADAITADAPMGSAVGSQTLIVGAGIYGDPVSEKSAASARGWLARFGRAVGSQAVEMISGRMNAPAPGGAKMTLGGQTVKLDADPERYLTEQGAGLGFASLAHQGIDPRSIARARTANRLSGGEEDSTGSYREMTMSQLLSGASFHLASTREAAEAAGSQWSIWGRGASSSFEGGGDAAIEGDVTTAMLGVDYEKGKLLAGVALSRSSGDGGFENAGRSELEATLTSVHPYFRYAASERLSLWGILGMGQGEMTLDESDSESGQKHETDIDMRMGAFGVRGVLTKLGGFDLAVKSDVLLTQMDSDAKDGLEAISAESSRLRVLLEASREVAMEGGGTFRPSVEAGLRHDGGDVDEGLGVEVGGSLRFTNPGMGLTFEVNARGLVTHEESDVADWGVGGMIRIAPGKAGRGLALTVEPSVGETAGSAARLWGLRDASRLAKEETGDLDPRVRAEVGYGLDAWGGLLTPYAGLSVSDSGNGTYRLGGRFRMDERLSMSLEGDVRERVNADPVHGVALRGSLRW
ncbi:MAG: hypothetical protein OXE44_04865 [Nitrospinae bacterium]|nr:hypothetical protein [Nitrospinota bacterium]